VSVVSSGSWVSRCGGEFRRLGGRLVCSASESSVGARVFDAIVLVWAGSSKFDPWFVPRLKTI
jgi:hypothetical protein